MLAKAQPDIAGRIEVQRGRIKRMDYTVIGKLCTIALDSDREGFVPEAEVAFLGRRISFTGNSPGGKSPLHPVALSLDQQEILLPSGLPLALPKIPRPGWQGRLTIKEETPWVEQLYEERASGRTMILNREWLVFQPVHKILMLSVGYFRANWPKIVCKPDWNGDMMALLFDPMTGEAHLVGGRFEPLTYQRVEKDAPNLTSRHWEGEL
jgi:hypothetical protein